MKIIRLRAEIIEKLQEYENKRLRTYMALRLNVQDQTINKYLRDNDIMLTTCDALDEISKGLKMPIENLVEVVNSEKSKNPSNDNRIT